MNAKRFALPIFAYGSLITGVLGCASATMTFQSAPAKAQVYAHAASTVGDGQLIGETPLTINASDLSKKMAAPGPIIVEFRKDGHLPAKIFVTDLSSTDVTINMELRVGNGLEDMRKLNTLLDQMFESQRLARSGRGDEALKNLTELKRNFPEVGAIYELEGGIYYLDKKYKEALDAYGLAIKYNPTNVSALKVRESIEQILEPKSATPAAKTGGSP